MKVEIIDWVLKWDIGSSSLTTDYNLNDEELKIKYRISLIDRNFEDEFATILFKYCMSFRFTKMRYDLNAFKRHKYFKFGLEHFEAHIIQQSDWLLDFYLLNPDFDKNVKLNHYLLSFKDEILEIIASDFILIERDKR